MLTPDQRLLLWHTLGGWHLAQVIVATDYGISHAKSMGGGSCWPRHFHPELPYNYTSRGAKGITGHTGLGTVPVVSVTYTQIRRWAGQVPEQACAEISFELHAAAAWRKRTQGWCRCPHATTPPNAHSGVCERFHPTDTEDRQQWDVLAELEARRDDMALAALGLTLAEDELVGQLELFAVSA